MLSSDRSTGQFPTIRNEKMAYTHGMLNSPAIRPGFSTVSPYLVLRDPAAALAYYQDVFGAKELGRKLNSEGAVAHAELRIGDSTLMMASENPRYAFMRAAESAADSLLHLFVYLPNVDAVFSRAIQLGAKEIMPVDEQAYGRSGGFRDPFGITWWVSTHKEQS